MQTTPFLRETLKTSAGKETKAKLKALKESHLTHRQVGASEATYKVIPSLKLKDSNISRVFVMTGFPEKRSYFFKKMRDEGDNDNEPEKEDSDSDEDVEKPSHKSIKIEGRPSMYKQSVTVINKYSKRPVHLEGMCPSQFAIS